MENISAVGGLAEAMGKRTIKFIVGVNEDQRVFVVHKRLITSQSSRRELLVQNTHTYHVQTDERGNVHLPHENAEAFAILVGLLYQGFMPDVDYAKVHLIMEAYTTAERLGLGNQMNKIIDNLQHGQQNDIYPLFSINHIGMIYQKASHGSKL